MDWLSKTYTKTMRGLEDWGPKVKGKEVSWRLLFLSITLACCALGFMYYFLRREVWLF